MTTTILYATIGGVAQVHTSSPLGVLRRFATAPLSGDTQAAYVECIPEGEYPSEVASEINPRDGTYSTGGLSLTFAAVPAVVSALLDGRQIATGTLTADLTRTATSMDTDVTDGSLAGTLRVIEREVIYVGEHAGDGTYTIARGQADTRAEPHSSSNTEGYPALLDASTLPVSRHRLVTVGRAVDDGVQGDYSAETRLWTGLLDGVSMAGPRVRVDAVPVWTLLDDATICNNLWSGVPAGTAEVYAGRGRPLATSARVTLVVDKIALLVRASYNYDADEDITTLTLPLTPAQGTALPDVAALAQAKIVREIHPCTGTSDNTYPPSRNALTLALQLLLTTHHGDNVGEGGEDYDLGEADLGVGLRADLVDIASFEAARDRLGDLAVMGSMYLGGAGESERLRDLLARLLRPLGCVVGSNQSGQITCVQLRDNTPAPSTTLGDANLLYDPDSGGALITTTPRPDLSYDALAVTWDHAPPFDPRRDVYRHLYRQRQALAAQSADMDLGQYTDEGVVRTLAVHHITRYSRPLLQIDVTALRSVEAEIGALVSLTSEHIPLGGARGVVALTCLVVARRLILDDGTLRLRLWAVGAVYNRTGLIAPSARVTAWDAGTNTYTVAANAFTTGTGTGIPTDAAGFEVGDHIDLCARSYGVRDDDQTVTAVGTNTITVSGAPKVTPAVGDLIRLAAYDNQDADGRAPWAWLWRSGQAWTPYNWTT